MSSIIFKTDSYKLSHYSQYPKGTEYVKSYLESRGGKFDNTVFFGLQSLIKKHLVGKLFTKKDIKKAKKFALKHMGYFNEQGWKYILKTHGGRLPLKIKAIPEGTPVSTRNVLMTVENTDPKCAWLTNYVEGLLLEIWYPITIATLSREIKKKLTHYMKLTTSYNDQEIAAIVQFQLHDFGYRGASSDQSARIGGSAHLLNFLGTDNIRAIKFAQKYYNTKKMLGFSIPASEHSTITSWGKEHEVDAYRNMLDVYPTGTVACVSDSYNILNACENLWGDELKDKIINREGRLVVRPDSGDPVQTLKRIFAILWDKFGGEVNEKGFKVLHPNIRVIQGDGVNYESINNILDMMVKENFSVENIVFGMGGALLQKIDRDTQNFAFKCSSITIDGEERDVQKSPMEINEMGEMVQSFKSSKAGNLKLTKEGDKYITVEHSIDDDGNLLDVVFENGNLITDYKYKEVRKRAELI